LSYVALSWWATSILSQRIPIRREMTLSAIAEDGGVGRWTPAVEKKRTKAKAKVSQCCCRKGLIKKSTTQVQRKYNPSTTQVHTYQNPLTATNCANAMPFWRLQSAPLGHAWQLPAGCW
jgi:hypothetical protein